jgi:hypothetical protein
MGSTTAMGWPASSLIRRHTSVDVVDLPLPGAPAMPTTCLPPSLAAAAARRASCSTTAS